MAGVEKVKPNVFASALGTASLYSFIPATVARVTSYRSLAIGASLTALAAGIFGLFKGISHSTKEENYINHLEMQNVALNTELQTMSAETKKFTNIIQSRTGQSSHASAHLADKENGVQAEASRL